MCIFLPEAFSTLIGSLFDVPMTHNDFLLLPATCSEFSTGGLVWLKLRDLPRILDELLSVLVVLLKLSIGNDGGCSAAEPIAGVLL